MTLLANAAATTPYLEAAGLLLAIALLLVAAQAGRLPYPLVLVVGGGALALIPGAPRIELNPELVLVIFLPILLYAAAFFSSLRDLRRQALPISTLAVGLVLATALAVAVAAHVLIGMDWPAAFVLGAVLSPTDPVAATAIAQRIGAPRRVVTIVEGESLINDSSALIIYKFAVLAVTSGGFSLWHASASFVLGVVGGLAIGILTGIAIVAIRRRIRDTTTEIAISLLTPYLAYLPAEAAGVSAVVAAVTSGVWLGWRSPWLVTPTYRLQAFAVWEVLQFVANAALFALVGMQLPLIAESLRDANEPTGTWILQGLLVAAVVMLVRIAWIGGGELLIRWLPRLRDLRPVGSGTEGIAIAWTGMRGAVSLATALAIPVALDDGTPFADRDRIILLAYVAILTTLLLQGLTLPRLLTCLGLRDSDDGDAEEEAMARAAMADAVLDQFDEITGGYDVPEPMANRLRTQYRFRQERHSAQHRGEADARLEAGSARFVAFRNDLLDAERRALLELRTTGCIGDGVMHRIQRDLDLEQERLTG